MIQAPVFIRQALLQVVLLMNDATSLPWSTVRTAWAMSMHAIEQGYLQWANVTQWSFNWLRASQITMHNVQPSSN